jgi:hypothetical protein
MVIHVIIFITRKLLSDPLCKEGGEEFHFYRPIAGESVLYVEIINSVVVGGGCIGKRY